MTDILSSICAGIVAIGGAASGITKAIDPPPAELNTADLPALWVFTGPAQILPNSPLAGYEYRRRTFRVQAAVLPTGQGSPATRETLCRPLLVAVSNALSNNPHLGGVDWVQDSKVASDSGIVILPEWGGKYIGFEVRLEVTYYEKRS